jgi:uncharacterized Zn-finger protein
MRDSRDQQPLCSIEDVMASSGVPHFHNDPGVREIKVGSREFMCIGATPPFDHPHIFIDMGTDSEAICSYCGTLYKYDASLSEGEAEPEACLWQGHVKAA